MGVSASCITPELNQRAGIASLEFFGNPFYLRCHYDRVLVAVVVFITIAVVVVLPGMLAVELATAFIMPMTPSMMFSPGPGYPHPFVTTVPIGRALVIWPIAQIDRDPDRRGVWPDQHANRQENRCKNRKFCFHSSLQIIRMRSIF
jgi:hypothetical protein